MSLVVEDGTGLPGAESFATVAELRAYAAKRAATVPSADAACETLLIKAVDYIQAQSERFKGTQSTGAQGLCWPRDGVVVSGYTLDSGTIPADLKAAQCQLAIEAQSVDLMPTLDAAQQRGPVLSKTVGPLSTTYAQPATNRNVTKFAKADGLLAKFYRGGNTQIPVTRA